MPRPVVLCVDDEKLVLDGIKEQLRRQFQGEYAIECVQSGEEGLELFDELMADGVEVPVVVSDHIMPGIKGAELLCEIHARRGSTLKILLTGQADADAVGRAVNAADLYRYISKPWSEDDLVLTLREALRRYYQDRKLEEQNDELERLNGELRRAVKDVEKLKRKVEAENIYLRQEIKHEHNFEEIIGTSDALRRVLRSIEQVAKTDATVLICGESGTGKELLARAVHNLSPRHSRPLVKVNCAALPANLIESELFGHEKGSFTGATARRTGRFELADSGTIFLDEIGEMPLSLQSKLLRVLQEGEFEHVGGSRTFAVDVRVIAATNRDLLAEVEAGRFREDLYFRLNVFPIMSPALRQRREDIPLLASHFVRKHGGKLGKHFDAISPRMLEQLESYDFPGNIRELENLIERATIVSESGTLELDQPLPVETAAAEASEAPGSAAADRTFHEVEVRMIRAALEACDWMVGGKSGAARKLEIPASTLRARIKRYGIERG